ncbi:MAG: hypothetical protein WC059_01120 [Candidatus Paceibacterota bacterium]
MKTKTLTNYWALIATRNIFLSSLWKSHLFGFAIYVLLRLILSKESAHLLLPEIFISTVIASLFLLTYRIAYKKDHNKLISKWREELRDLIEQQNRQAIEQIILKKNYIEQKRSSLSIKNIYGSNQNCCEFILEFDEEVIARPIVKVAGILMKISHHTPTMAIGTIKPMPNTPKLVFETETYKSEIINPYYMDIKPEDISWQIKGHVNERKIYISGDSMLCKQKSCLYAFEIIVYGKPQGPFWGEYDEETDCIIVSVANGSFKASYSQKSYFLRLLWNKNILIELPKPKIILVNGQKV